MNKQIKEQTNLLIAWPAVSPTRHKEEIIKILKENHYDIIDIRVCSLSYDQLRSLMYVIYQQEHWIGHSLNHFKGLTDKASACYHTDDMVVFLLNESSPSQLIKLKNLLREHYKINKSSFHSSDSLEEVKKILDIINQIKTNRFDTQFENQVSIIKSLLLSLKRRIMYHIGILFLHHDKKIK